MRIFALLGVLAVLGLWGLPRTDSVEPELKDDVYLIIQPAPQSSENEMTIAVRTSAGICEMPLEEYLIGVVLTEMPASFEIEALKAQAVAARTFSARRVHSGKHQGFHVCTDFQCCQAWRSELELREAFGESYEMYYEKAQRAVYETAGFAGYYNGELIDAVYYACAGGQTEPAVAVWGTDVPYLVSVDSPWEENCEKFFSEIRVPFSEFKRKIMLENPNAVFPVIPQDWFGTPELSQGEGVVSVTIANVTFSGGKVRTMFDLPSTKFTAEIDNGAVVFSVYGSGHRVGLSQYGANGMAKSGYNYEEILLHYYPGISIEKLSRN